MVSRWRGEDRDEERDRAGSADVTVLLLETASAGTGLDVGNPLARRFGLEEVVVSGAITTTNGNL